MRIIANAAPDQERAEVSVCGGELGLGLGLGQSANFS